MNYIISNKEKQTIQDVKLTDIIALPEFNPREKVEENLVKDLAKVELIPAIKLARFDKLTDKLIIVDGNHRYNSRFLRNEETIPAFIYEYDSESELFKDATLANLCHGKMLTKKEKINSISKIIQALEEDEKPIVYSELASEIGGLDRRELQKIHSWNIVKNVLGENATGLDFNISKGDILHRLLKNVKTEEEFKNFYQKYGHWNFIDLNNAINKYIKGELIDSNEVIVDKIDTIAQINDELTKEELEEFESYEASIENFEETPVEDLKTVNEKVKEKQIVDLNVIDIIEEIQDYLDEKIYIIEFAKSNNQPLEKTGHITKLKELENKIEKFRAVING